MTIARQVPLGRALSKLGLASRSEARVLIRDGRVRVDGRLVTDPLRRIDLDRARIAIDGSAAPARERTLIAFHKPRGVVTTRRDPRGRRTVFDVLGDAGRGLVAVGRLDLASTGLLLFTNDTALADRLTDPRSRVLRRYVVTVRGRVTPDDARRLERGLELPRRDGGSDRLHADRVDIRKDSGRETHLIVTLTEGKNRELRRLFEAIGHEVTRLHRIAFGEYGLGALQPGEWRQERTKSHGHMKVWRT
jgi:23S rRNA pseudouridine2605 synthase